MIIEDIAGKPVTAMKVFGTSIRALIWFFILPKKESR
jgi:hypothetical protein